MSNIWIKYCSRPQKKKKKACFLWNTPWTVIIVWLKWNVTNNKWTIKWQRARINPKSPGEYWISVCSFLSLSVLRSRRKYVRELKGNVMLCASVQPVKPFSKITCSGGELWKSKEVIQHFFFKLLACYLAENERGRQRNEETHVSVTGSVSFPLSETVLASSRWAERHNRNEWGMGKRDSLHQIT